MSQCNRARNNKSRQSKRGFFATTALTTAVFLVAAPVEAQVAASAGSIDTAFSTYESSNDVSATNPNSTATGSYQDTVGFLESAGVLAAGSSSQVTAADYGNSDWSNLTFAQNQWGITSRKQLLDASPAVQTAIENAGLTSIWGQLGSNGATNFIGQTAPGGQVINQSALLACGEHLGAGGCQSYLENGTTGNPALDTQVQQEMEAMSQTDSSSITGQPTNSVSEVPGGPTEAGANGNHTFMYCPPTISQAMEAIAIANVNQAVTVASNPALGYSLADGSPISASGVGGSGGEPDDFGVASCLSNLFSFQGLSFLFTTPNLNAIIQHLVGMACSYAENVKTQMLSPLNQSTFDGLVPQGFQPFIGQQGFGASSSLGSYNGGVGFNVASPGSEATVFNTNPITGPDGSLSTGNVDLGVAAPYMGGGLLP